ncbi:SDR family oxidoreductase [Halomonas denitrificans]|uniref:SDR family oxidoreductase n=1 Tax=Halomonas denitrificans TaxID=370769 RepID=UPI001CD4F9BA|nr:SDR family oxidoreductase [Halomonas denitrificans]MCA0975090.1 SDR family oxidoreductase [Halomonas denitrificans]
MSTSCNQRVLLTGASGGIGSALARQLDEEGATLWLVGRDTGKLRALVKQLGGDLPRHRLLGEVDLTLPAGRQRVLSWLQETPLEQRPSTLIQLAGINHLGWFQHHPQQNIADILNTNLTSTLLLTHTLLPLFLEQPAATLYFVGSLLGHIGHPGYAAYCASKAGLKGFTEALGRELAATSVRVQYLAPRATRTSMNDKTAEAMNASLGNAVDTPEAVADAIVAQLKSGQQRRRLGAAERLFDALNGLVPGVVDRGINKKLPHIARHLDARAPLERNET